MSDFVEYMECSNVAMKSVEDEGSADEKAAERRLFRAFVAEALTVAGVRRAPPDPMLDVGGAKGSRHDVWGRGYVMTTTKCLACGLRSNLSSLAAMRHGVTFGDPSERQLADLGVR